VPPVRVGILAFVHRNPRRPFGEQTGYIRGLLLAGRRLGLSVYAFGPQNVAADGRIRHAYMLGPGAGAGARAPAAAPTSSTTASSCTCPRPIPCAATGPCAAARLSGS